MKLGGSAATKAFLAASVFGSVTVAVDALSPSHPAFKGVALSSLACKDSKTFLPQRLSRNFWTRMMSEGDNAEASTVKQQERLQSLLDYIQNIDEGRASFGLDASEKEQDLVASVITEVENDEKNNLVSQRKDGEITFADLQGNWQLLYTSSRTMIINKSLTGLGRSSSEYAQVASLVMKLGGNKYIGAVEFVETFGENALEVFVTGEWFTQPGTNMFTRQPTTSIMVDPETVSYGLGNNKADDWSSLGPIKLLDLLYLSHDVMISRGSVNPKSLFVWKRVK